MAAWRYVESRGCEPGCQSCSAEWDVWTEDEEADVTGPDRLELCDLDPRTNRQRVLDGRNNFWGD